MLPETYLVGLEPVIALIPIAVTETEAKKGQVTLRPQGQSTNKHKLVLRGVLGYMEGAT